MTCEGDQMVCESSGHFTKECQTSEEIQSYSCVKVADVSPKVQNSSATDSNALRGSRFDDQSNNDGSTFDKMSQNPHEEDAQIPTLSGRLTDEMDEADLRTSAPDNCQLVINDCGNEKPEPLDLPNFCYTGEQVFEENRLCLDDCVLDGFSTIPEESQQKFTLRCVDLKEIEETGISKSESEVSKTLSLMPPAMSDCRSNVAEIVKSQDNFASVLEDKAMVESYNLDSRNDSQLNCQDCCLELDSVDEVQAIGAVTAHDMDASFLKTGDFTSQLHLNVLVEDISRELINLMGDKIIFSGEEISMVSASRLNAEDRILNQSPEVHVSSFEGRESFEVCLTDNIGNCAGMSSKVSDLGGSGPQSPHGKYKSLDEENKKDDEGSDMIKERALGDLREHTSVSKYACSAVGHIRCSKKPGSDRKPEGIVIKPPSDALPFSDEWLAALEAAGEEILTKKSGAVQNSPPNKSQPQQGPWSPVKRKANQVIGPFDCTKHTNNGPPTSQ